MWPAIIAGVAGLAGAALNSDSASQSRTQAENAQKRALAAYNNIPIPDPEQLKLYLQQYASQGSITPDTEVAQQLAATDALQDVELDPRLKRAQMDQLSTLQQLGDTGLSPIERAQLSKMQNEVESDNTARLKAILQQQDARGVGSSDVALAVRAIGSQSAANRQAQATQDTAAQAFARALQAKASAAGLAGTMEEADYARQSALANSLNQREAANVSQKAGTQQRNIDRFNQSQMANLNNAQRIADSNVDLGNKQQQYNKELKQQDFTNRRSIADGISGAQTRIADSASNAASASDRSAGGFISGAAQIGASIFGNKKTEEDGAQTNTGKRFGQV